MSIPAIGEQDEGPAVSPQRLHIDVFRTSVLKTEIRLPNDGKRTDVQTKENTTPTRRGIGLAHPWKLPEWWTDVWQILVDGSGPLCVSCSALRSLTERLECPVVFITTEFSRTHSSG